MCASIGPFDIIINILFYFALNNFMYTIANLLAYVLCILTVGCICTRLMKPNKVQTGRRLLTGSNDFLNETV